MDLAAPEFSVPKQMQFNQVQVLYRALAEVHLQQASSCLQAKTTTLYCLYVLGATAKVGLGTASTTRSKTCR